MSDSTRMTREWLRRKIEIDPDLPCEAGHWPDPTDQARQAVIDAAMVLEADFTEWEPLPARGWDDDQKIADAAEGVAKAVRAYLALTQPAGKRPEEVEPGTRFRFVNVPGTEGEPYTLFNLAGGGRVYLDGKTVCAFAKADLIIPLEQD